jgi:hypothetical protein
LRFLQCEPRLLRADLPIPHSLCDLPHGCLLGIDPSREHCPRWCSCDASYIERSRDGRTNAGTECRTLGAFAYSFRQASVGLGCT